MSKGDEWKVDLPEGDHGAVSIRRVTVNEDQSKFDMIRSITHGSSRYVPPGTYTALNRNGTQWMTDTPDEIRDLFGYLRAVSRPDRRSVLIGGLGLGIAVKMALAQPHVERVDVVEIDGDVIGAVGPHYADPRLTIHEGDMLTIKWPRNSWWDAAWFDIWPSITSDNLPEMARLNRSYARRTGWRECWLQHECQYLERQYRSQYGRWY